MEPSRTGNALANSILRVSVTLTWPRILTYHNRNDGLSDDVHFYASFALAMLWPALELSLQRDFAKAVAQSDNCARPLLHDGYPRPRKVAGVVAHDLGAPSEEPWRKVNADVLQDVTLWKDLGSKFALQIFRDFKATGSKTFLNDMYPTVLAVLTSMLEKFDRDGDGLIENDGDTSTFRSCPEGT